MWHTLMSPISRSILSNFVLSARFIYATRSFSCCFFFSLVSLVRVWMEQLLSRWKRKMLSVTQLFCHSRTCNLILAILLLQAALFQQEWKRHLSSTISKCKEIRFFFLFSEVIFVKTISIKCRNFKQNFAEFLLSCMSTTVANNRFC